MKEFFKMLLASFLGVLVATIIGGLFMFAIIGSLASFASSSTPTVPSSAILNMNFASGIGEQTIEEPFDLSSFSPVPGTSSKRMGILSMVQVIDKAAEDPAIKLILLNTSNMNVSISYTEEIRDAILRFRTSGKAVIAYSENLSQTGYYLASAADKIYIDPLGSNDIVGVSTNILFFKDILDRMGVNIQLIRHGKYKAAGEQFINSNISAANREQNQALVDALWETISSSICESRDIELSKFNSLVNNLSLTTPEELMEAHLIDGIFYKDEMAKHLCELYGAEKEEDLKYVTPEVYAKARIKPNLKAKGKIAIIYANGEIVMGKGEGISSDKYADIFKTVRKDSTIKAVVLRVNSPGGNAQAAEIIRRELMLLKEVKPVIASYGDYAASGGYWISANCDKIFTSNTTLTGSIGVFSLFPSFGTTLKGKLHVNPVNINTNKHSDMFSLMRPLNENEVASMQKTVEIVYDKFLSIVSEGREMDTEEVDKVAQGRVWAGSDALTIDLADSAGGLYDALSYAVSISDLTDYRLVEYPAVKTSIQKVMESMGQVQSTVEMVNNPEVILENIISEMEKSKGVFARMPFIYQF